MLYAPKLTPAHQKQHQKHKDFLADIHAKAKADTPPPQKPRGMTGWEVERMRRAAEALSGPTSKSTATADPLASSTPKTGSKSATASFPPQAEEVRDVVADFYQVNVEDMAADRLPVRVRARQVTMYLLSAHLHMSMRSINRFIFGYPDYSRADHSVQRIRSRLGETPAHSVPKVVDVAPVVDEQLVAEVTEIRHRLRIKGTIV